MTGRRMAGSHNEAQSEVIMSEGTAAWRQQQAPQKLGVLQYEAREGPLLGHRWLSRPPAVSQQPALLLLPTVYIYTSEGQEDDTKSPQEAAK